MKMNIVCSTFLLCWLIWWDDKNVCLNRNEPQSDGDFPQIIFILILLPIAGTTWQSWELSEPWILAAHSVRRCHIVLWRLRQYNAPPPLACVSTLGSILQMPLMAETKKNKIWRKNAIKLQILKESYFGRPCSCANALCYSNLYPFVR